MQKIFSSDICVIGAGSGGLIVASGAAALGAEVILVEENLMGGDCLNYGCVPSKSLIAAARMASYKSSASQFGVDLNLNGINYNKLYDHIDNVIKSIAPNDSESRFKSMGIRIIKGKGKFIDEKTLMVENNKILAKKFVIATGSSPKIPEIKGLHEIPYITNETLFEKRIKPSHLLIIGGGPIGLEIGQAFNHLGAKVTIVDEAKNILAEDPEISKLLTGILLSEGIELILGAEIIELLSNDDSIILTLAADHVSKKIEGSHLLIAAGRIPNKDIGIELAGIKSSKTGIEVNDKYRTSNKKVYAIGDVLGKQMYTHAASYQARMVLQNIFFKFSFFSKSAIPEVIYTFPEYASVGLYENDARLTYDGIKVLRWPVFDNDRAHTERIKDGLIKVVVGQKGTILGVQILAPNAGDLITMWVLAIDKGIKLSKISSLVLPYPTISEISKQAAASFFYSTLSNKWIKKIAKFLSKF